MSKTASKRSSLRSPTTAVGALIVVAASATSVAAGTPPGLVHRHDIASTCREQTMTMRQHEAGQPVLFVAAKAGGLKIYNVADSPELLATIPSAQLASLDVMNLSQSGDRLFLALGDHFSRRQAAGVAVIDIKDPSSPIVLDVWHRPDLKGGAGIVAVEGDIVYLGAMGNGLVLLRVSESGRLSDVSRLVPSITYPDPSPDPRKYNARGMAVRNGLVYLAYDAGGLRIIDANNREQPVEIGRYSNPLLDRKPRAYNNIVLDGDLAIVTVDYCGLEVLDISDPTGIRQVSWWNPEDCQVSGWKWFRSPIHTNEIAFDSESRLAFLSSGKSDLQIVDLGDPAKPEWHGEYGGVDNAKGTWGVSMHGDRVYLSYICTLGIPFASNWSGVEVLEFQGKKVDSSVPNEGPSS